MARRQVTISINGQEVAANIKQIYREKRKLNAELNNMVIGTEEYIETAGKIRNLNGIIRDHREEVGRTRKGYDALLRSGLTKIAAFTGATFATDTIIQYGRELFKLGAEMEVLGAKAETVFGRALPLVTREAERNANAMGFTISQYTDAAAAIGDLLVPMGFQRQEAANISTQLVNLSGALSEWTGGQVTAEQASNALSKALLGEREELKTLGIAIREADVQNRLREKGLDNLTGKLLEQAKATATLELILEKSVDAQNAFSENSDKLVRRQAELSAKLTEVAEKLATALLPVFERLIDFADSAADRLLDVTDAFTGLLDPVQGAADAFVQQRDSVNLLEKELNPLLDRYEELQGKANRSEEENAELAEVIDQIGKLTPTAVTEIDKYGRALSINAEKSREFLEAERKRLEFANQDLIQSTNKQIESLTEQRDALQAFIETGEGGLGLGLLGISREDEESVKRVQERVAELTRTIEGAQAQLDFLTGANLEPNTPSGGGAADEEEDEALSPTEAELAAQAERAKKLREQRREQAEKEMEERMRQLERLEEVTRDFAERERLARLSEEERKLEKIRLKYEEQIELAKELEAQGVEEATDLRIQLEQQKFEELTRVAAEQHQARLEQRMLQIEEEIQAEVDAELEKSIRLQEAKQQIKEYTDETELTERQKTLLDLQEQYDDMIGMAEDFGLNTEEITKSYRQRVAEVNEEFDEKEIEQLKQLQAKRAAILADTFGAIGSTVGGLIDLVGNKTQEAAEFSRALAIAEIATKTAEAIARGVSQAMSLGFPANIAVIGTTVGTVLSNMANAKRILSEEPVPQGYTGGLFDVTGAQDGKSYRAKYIGRPGTGLLPSRPVLMASERGPEYLVANEDLKNPKVLDYVRAIENIRRSRMNTISVPQYQEGGFTDQAPQLSSTTDAGGILTGNVDRQLIEDMYMVMRDIRDNGVNTVLGDDILVDIQRRYRKLNDASGGVL